MTLVMYILIGVILVAAHSSLSSAVKKPETA